jgi:hypothetical protein
LPQTKNRTELAEVRFFVLLAFWKNYFIIKISYRKCEMLFGRLIMKGEITISKTSWHYRYLNWESVFKPGCERSEIPTNICPYFWKVAGLLAVIPLWMVWLMICFLVLGIGWFLGRWPNFGKYSDGTNNAFHNQYKYDGRKRHRFAPWEIVLPLAVIFGLVFWGIKAPKGLMRAGIGTGIGIGITLAIAGLVFLIVKGWKSNTFRLFREYLKARKAKACPKIKFVD